MLLAVLVLAIGVIAVLSLSSKQTGKTAGDHRDAVPDAEVAALLKKSSSMSLVELHLVRSA